MTEINHRGGGGGDSSCIPHSNAIMADDKMSNYHQIKSCCCFRHQQLILGSVAAAATGGGDDANCDLSHNLQCCCTNTINSSQDKPARMKRKRKRKAKWWDHLFAPDHISWKKHPPAHQNLTIIWALIASCCIVSSIFLVEGKTRVNE